MLATVEDMLGTPVSFTDFIEAPTIAQLARELDGVDRAPRPAQAPVEHRENGRAPCSFGQERLWFLEQLTGRKAVYNMPLARRLRGETRRGRARRALQTIVGRHGALRTTFERRRTAHRARGRRARGRARRSIVATYGGRRIRRRRRQRLADELASDPFDLGATTARARLLFRLADEDYVLELVFHHIICDGWSHVVVFDELGAVLSRAGERRGSGAARTADPVRRVRGRRRACRPEPRSSRREGALTGASGSPGCRRRSSCRQTVRGPRVSSRTTENAPYPAVESRRDPRLRARRRSDLVATLLAAYDVLLSPRTPARRRSSSGRRRRGRDRSELDGAVGLFASTVVLAHDLGDDPVILRARSKHARRVLDAVAHQDAPFERLVADLQPERDSAGTRSSRCSSRRSREAPLDVPGAEPFDQPAATARFDLTLWVEESGRGSSSSSGSTRPISSTPPRSSASSATSWNCSRRRSPSPIARSRRAR